MKITKNLLYCQRHVVLKLLCATSPVAVCNDVGQVTLITGSLVDLGTILPQSSVDLDKVWTHCIEQNCVFVTLVAIGKA